MGLRKKLQKLEEQVREENRISDLKELEEKK